MCTRKVSLTGALVAGWICLGAGPLFAQSGYPLKFEFGEPATPQALGAYFAIAPSGAGLPPGKGSYEEGMKIYADVCASCHGEKLEGNPQKGLGGDKLIGGRGTLATKAPIKTIESYWPYATTIFDYVKRAMPFNAPGSLTDQQVYSVVAYILVEAHIIKRTDTIDASTLPRVQMPNRDGFVGDPRPEIELYR